MKYNKILKEVERIEGMEAAQLTDQGGMGMIDGTPMVSQAEIDKSIANINRIAETIDPSVVDPRSAKSIENRALMDEKEATERAKKKFDPLFGYSGLKNQAENVDSDDYLPEPLKIDLTPITYKSLSPYEPVSELPANVRTNLEDEILPKGQFKPQDRSLSNYYYQDPFTGKTVMEQELEDYNRAQKFKQAFQQPGILGTQDKFATGGRAGYNDGKLVEPVEIDFASAEDKAFSDMMKAFRYYIKSGGKKSLREYMRMSTGAGRKGGGKEHFRGAGGGIAKLSGGVDDGPPPAIRTKLTRVERSY